MKPSRNRYLNAENIVHERSIENATYLAILNRACTLLKMTAINASLLACKIISCHLCMISKIHMKDHME